MNRTENSKRIWVALAAFVLLCFLGRGEETMAAAKKSGIKPVYLRCEYKVNPLGIDVKKPRLSWELSSCNPDRHGQRQTAYEIQAATSKSLLTKGQPDLWDSGMLRSDATNQITYRGRALKSHMECWWRVRVSDEQGATSPWSEPAYWSMGVLNATDWKARWIGYDKPVPRPEIPAEMESQLSLSACRWVWFPEGNPADEAPVGSRYFRRTLSIPDGVKIRSASFLLTADDQFTLYVNGVQAGKSDGKRDAWKRPRTLVVADSLRCGINTLAIEATNTTVSPAGLAGVLVVLLDNGDSVVQRINRE